MKKLITLLFLTLFVPNIGLAEAKFKMPKFERYELKPEQPKMEEKLV